MHCSHLYPSALDVLSAPSSSSSSRRSRSSSNSTSSSSSSSRQQREPVNTDLGEQFYGDKNYRRYAANPEAYHIRSDEPIETIEIANDLLPPIDYDSVPVEEILEKVIPDSLIGQDLINLYHSLEQH